MSLNLLLVPGTGATDFRDRHGAPTSYGMEVLWGQLSGHDAITDELSCEHAWITPPFDPTRTSLRAGFELAPHQVLRGTLYKTVPASYAAFPYDWRLDIRHNAARLLERLKRSSSEGRPVRIIAHSQGGLVVLAASKLCSDRREFSRYVSKIALVGCPLYGTLRAAHILLDGTNFGGVAADFLKTASRTWPSIFQMLPAYEAVEARPGWTGMTRQLWGVEPLLLPMLERARAFQDWFHRGGLASHLSGKIDLRLYFSTNFPTPYRFSNPTAGLHLAAETERGDNLVPFDHTHSRLRGEGLASFIRVLSGATIHEHVTLLNDGRVFAICDAFLRS